MRICLYTNTALPKVGGQELAVDALARQFLIQGHDPLVVAPRRPSQGKFEPQSLPYPVAWHPRFCSTRWFVSWYGHWLAQLHRRQPFDVVHCQGTYPAGYVAASCAALKDLPLVITSQGDDLGTDSLFSRKADLRPRYRLALARSSSAVAISRYCSERMRAACPEIGRVDDIPNGVDTARFAKLVGRPADLHPAIEPRRYFLFIGRLELRKAVDILLHATSNILDRCPHHVVIAGKGPKAEELEQLAQRLGLSSRVHFLGQVQGDAKTYLLQNSLATVVCSRFYEGLPLVVLESYASGRPVIATDVPGMVDVIHHEETGLCVPQENSAALAHAMLQTALNPQRAEQWGSNARKLAQSYDWSNVARRHLELFAELKARKDKLAA